MLYQQQLSSKKNTLRYQFVNCPTFCTCKVCFCYYCIFAYCVFHIGRYTGREPVKVCTLWWRVSFVDVEYLCSASSQITKDRRTKSVWEWVTRFCYCFVIFNQCLALLITQKRYNGKIHSKCPLIFEDYINSVKIWKSVRIN